MTWLGICHAMVDSMRRTLQEKPGRSLTYDVDAMQQPQPSPHRHRRKRSAQEVQPSSPPCCCLERGRPCQQPCTSLTMSCRVSACLYRYQPICPALGGHSSSTLPTFLCTPSLPVPQMLASSSPSLAQAPPPQLASPPPESGGNAELTGAVNALMRAVAAVRWITHRR